jgi:hypothetical protein
MSNLKTQLSVPLFQQTAIPAFKAVKVYLHVFLYLVPD